MPRHCEQRFCKNTGGEAIWAQIAEPVASEAKQSIDIASRPPRNDRAVFLLVTKKPLLYYIWYMNNNKKCLLIWPPMIVVRYLPLGIPSLVAYLKKNGVSNTEVLDLNMAFLKSHRLFWLAYRFNKWYHSIAGDVSRKLKQGSGTASSRHCEEPEMLHRATKQSGPRLLRSPGPTNSSLAMTGLRTRQLAQKILLRSYSLINRIINEISDYRKIGSKIKGSIPWSLDSIIGFENTAGYRSHHRRISRVLVPYIRKNRINVIGISACYPEQLYFALMIAKAVKDVFGGGIEIVLGGSQITKHIRQLTGDRRVAALVDFLVEGDGEEALSGLLRPSGRGNLSDIPNLYRRSGSGYIKPSRSFRLPPDKFITPDFSGFDLKIYRDYMPLLASKGCFWSKCNFCTYASMKEHAFSIASVGNALNIIKGLKKACGAAKFRFVDDALPPKFMKELAHSLIKEDLGITWSCSIILRREFKDTDLCGALKASGLSHVAIGLESANSRILRKMNKCHRDLDKRDIRDILASLKGAGVSIGLHIIFGFPTETIDEARETLDFLIQNKNIYDTCMFQPFSLEDDTPVYANPSDFGITDIDRNDKSCGERLGYKYKVSRGMSQEEARNFTYGEALSSLRKARVVTITSGK